MTTEVLAPVTVDTTTRTPAPAHPEHSRPKKRRRRPGRSPWLFVLLGVVGTLLAFVALFTVVFFGPKWILPHSEAYKTSFAYVQHHPDVVARLGESVSSQSVPEGKILWNHGYKSSVFTIDLTGPRGSGQAVVTARTDGERWLIETAQLAQGGEVIVLTDAPVATN